MKKNFSYTWWTILTFVSFGLWLFGIVAEKWGGTPACRMCLIIRHLFLITGIFSSLTGLMQEKAIGRAFGWATTLLVMALFGVAAYHSGLQYGWIRPAKFCAVHHSATSLDSFLGIPTASCHERTLEIMGLPASLYVMILSAFSTVACVMASRKPSKK